MDSLTSPSSNTLQSIRYSKAYFEVFCISMILLWLPIKVFSYAVPFIAITWFIVRSNSGITLLKSILYVMIYAVFVGVLCFLYWIVDEEFVFQNTIISFFTYSSLLFFIAIPYKASLMNVEIKKYINVIKWFIVIESMLGILQIVIFVFISGSSFDTAAGDIINGSLSPFSFLYPEAANFNNQIFTYNLFFLLLFFTPYVIDTKTDIWVCVLGMVAILLASVWHLLIVFIFSVIFITFYFRSSLIKISNTRIVMVACLILAIAAIALVQPRNFKLISFYFNNITSNKSPKTLATIKSLTELPDDYPWVYFTGLGPGQYCSRAGLIGTGKYFGGFSNPQKLPFLHDRSSKAFEKYMFSIWKEVSINVAKYGNSTMARPFCSLLSVLIEFGYLISVIIIIIFITFILKCKKKYLYFFNIEKNLYSYYVLSCAIALLFIFMTCFFENYLELVQAIFPGVILIRYFYSYILSGSNFKNV